MRDMTTLRPWLAPTLLGPLCVMWGLATLGSLVMGVEAISFGLLDDWALLMMWATFFGSTMGVFLVGADVTLLKLKWRRLPTGLQAWLSSVATPFACYGAWVLLPPPSTPLGGALFVLGPMFAAALVTRTLLGSRP